MHPSPLFHRRPPVLQPALNCNPAKLILCRLLCVPRPLSVPARPRYGSPHSYVRRELRQLTEEDRTLFFETSRIMWDVHGDKGRKTYGETYMSASDLTRIHSSLAADRECDHVRTRSIFSATYSHI